MLDPRDFIDPDEGREEPKPFYDWYAEPCENCGKPVASGERIWIDGFNYWGCSDCAEECRVLIFAEQNCETLYLAILRSKSVAEVQRAFREHKESCPYCRGERVQGKPVQSEGAPVRKREAA